MSDELKGAIEAGQASFGVEVTTEMAAVFSRYFEILGESNERLHLVAPCGPDEFAVRHILESLFIADMLPEGAKIVDVGSGAGLPGIPLAICREDLKVILIESKKKKADFLSRALEECGLSSRAGVINRQFSESMVPKDAIVTARALDRFSRVLPKLVKWASGRRLILFGGPSLREALGNEDIAFEETLIPMSEQRLVFDTGAR